MTKKKRGLKIKRKGSKPLLISSGLIAIGILLAFIVVWKSEGGRGSNDYPIPPGGEDRPVLSPLFFVGKASRAYEAAREMPDVMDKVWCYCDCVRHSGHKSLLSCFAEEHGSRCAVCILEAIETRELHKEGYSVERIRKIFHSRFGR